MAQTSSKPEIKNNLSTNGNGNGKSASKGKMAVRSRNDMPEENRSQMVALCNAQLADLFDLRSMVKQAHWNVRGTHFIALHKLFDEFAAILDTHVDTVAERATAFGGFAMGTVRMAAAASRLEEYPAELVKDLDHAAAVADRISAVAATTRKAIDRSEELEDMGSSDMFTDVVRDLDEYLWFVEAHLQA